ncbi:putative Sin3 binding protein-domain-containing protein [Chaetomidium leptoderma]|uniref:Sin3 binding protein-domain-containing protein n=1 Tax=Chaetomidium leptoderma TaxID=669021 RepID=A0AAN7A1F9_9PEZI|nr:putative Sin3 binding protein-domain-containing protein [Chaetomidium leptoderma]
MATMASAVRDIAMTSGRDNLTAVAARSVPVATHPTTLPTPPNSISPTLPAHGLKAQLQRARLDSIDSDLDLLEGREAHHAGLGSPPYDSSGAITPAMLAKFHLPEILLTHGPLPIRHLMGYLTTSVPGFAGIAPAKARRLVVGALEGKGAGNEGGGVDGGVEFMKVGWGRWDARRRGYPARESLSRRASPGAHPNSIPIIKTPGWADRSRFGAALGSSLGGGSAAFSHDDRFTDMDMMDHEADKMSLDGSGSASCSEAPDDDDMRRHNDDPEDATDDEDWAAVGAAALRASSNQARSHQQQFPFNSVHTSAGGGIRSFSTGMARAPQLSPSPLNFNFPASAFGAVASDAQEREAVEALLRLGSM